MVTYMTYTLTDRRINRALYAEWDYYYGKTAAGLLVPHDAWYMPIIQTLGNLGIMEYNLKREIWFLTVFAKEHCLFSLEDDETVLVIRIPTEG